MATRARGWATLGVGALLSYLLIVLLHGREVAGVLVRSRHLMVALPLAFVAAFACVRWLARGGRLGSRGLALVALSTLGLLGAVLVADTVVAVRTFGRYESDALPRKLDPVRWLAYSLAPKYHPTEKNFLQFKPNVRMAAVVYGPGYRPALRQSPTLLEHVLEPKAIEYAIDEHGFRDSDDPRAVEIFALGDGLTAGSFSRLEDHWIQQLEPMLGRPIYNLGVGGTTPKQQLMLLEHLLETRPEVFPVKHLIWTINESGDLEGSYATTHGLLEGRRDPLRGSLLRALLSLLDEAGAFLSTVRCQSLIERFTGTGEGCRRWDEPPYQPPHWIVDGVLMSRPLYRSERYGYKVFDPVLLEVAAAGPEYVLEHPNRPLLDETFERMRQLAKRHGFRVTVVMTPNDVRLYAPYFEDFPPIDPTPHFIDYVVALARRMGFEVIDLYPLLRPHAARELLNWRDDTHWNPRGERVVAELLRERL